MVVGLLALCCSGWAAAPDVNALPKPTGYVSDLAHVIAPADKERLETFCKRVDDQIGVQFALVTIDTIGDEPIDRFSIDLARAWGVGSKQSNQGILVLLVIKDRKSRVEIGRGAEPYVTDGFAGRTLRAMRPDLESGQYGAAFLEGARAMAAEVAQGKGVTFSEGDGLPPRAPAAEQPVPEPQHGLPIGQIIIGIIVLLFILRLFGRGGRGGGGGGFWTGFLLSSLLNSGGGRGGGWGGGGGGFGGDSGGGGGFGGFGGGDFGGGGASSDW